MLLEVYFSTSMPNESPSSDKIAFSSLSDFRPKLRNFSISDSDLMLWLQGVKVGLSFDVHIGEIDVAPLQIQGPRSADLMVDLVGPELGLVRAVQREHADAGRRGGRAHRCRGHERRAQADRGLAGDEAEAVALIDGKGGVLRSLLQAWPQGLERGVDAGFIEVQL